MQDGRDSLHTAGFPGRLKILLTGPYLGHAMAVQIGTGILKRDTVEATTKPVHEIAHVTVVSYFWYRVTFFLSFPF